MRARVGRVLAIDHQIARVRFEREDAQLLALEDWRPGDVISEEDLGDGFPRYTVVRRYAGPPYPGPATEVARLPRDRMTALQQRAKALAAVREFFARRDFVEVETPLLVPSPGLEIHLDAVPAGDGFLITSPEYQMKRLLAGGFERIYQVCKCFRGNERGPHHSGEFTMIEWYRALDSLDAIIDDTEQLVASVVTALLGTTEIPQPGEGRTWEQFVLDVKPPWPRKTVRDAMREWAGVEVIGDEPAADLIAKVRAAGIEVDDGAAWDDAFFAAFLARVEPRITTLGTPLILHDWPAPLAALARRKPDDPLTALRFEAYLGGMELANAFDELIDPIEQRARFEDDLRIRRARNRPVYPIDDKLIAALAEGLPPSAGIALGFDRLVMVATGAPSIDRVLTFTAGER
jgi:lysyl-tRNA synthetase class 2